MEHIIVSQHAGTEAFLRTFPQFATAQIITGNATPDDVRGKIVGGNLPLTLAAEAAEVQAVCFSGPPPRGREYTLADMVTAGAHLRRFTAKEVI